MAAMPSTGQLIYHMTSIDNLSSILKFGLLSRNHLLQNSNIQFTDIADPEILSIGLSGVWSGIQRAPPPLKPLARKHRLPRRYG